MGPLRMIFLLSLPAVKNLAVAASSSVWYFYTVSHLKKNRNSPVELPPEVQLVNWVGMLPAEIGMIST